MTSWIKKITIVIIPLILLSFSDQQKNLIDLNSVKKDIIADPNNFIPKDFIQNKRTFLLDIYADNYCFVHLQHKYYQSECFMQTSEVVIYKLTDNRWVFKKLVPYFYEISLLNEQSKVFISKNQFCEPTGICMSYTELDNFESDQFNTLKKYSGFNKINYYQGRLALRKEDELLKVVGDTISDEYFLSDFNFPSQKDISFKLLRRTSILKSFSDTLNVVVHSKSSLVKVGE